MLQSTSLRAIGQSLEILGIDVFEVNRDGSDYVVTLQIPANGDRQLSSTALAKMRSVADCDNGSESSDYQGSLRYSSISIAWLDAYGRRKKGRNHAFADCRGRNRLSHLLRTLGQHLDGEELLAIDIVWASDRVSVAYFENGGEKQYKQFSLKELHDRHLAMTVHRSGPSKLSLGSQQTRAAVRTCS